MAADKLEIVLCRTCLRDNPGEGIFESFEACAEFYREKLKRGWFKKVAELSHQNCYTYCEKFYCVSVFINGQGLLFQKISSEAQALEIIRWLESKPSSFATIPEQLREYVIVPLES